MPMTIFGTVDAIHPGASRGSSGDKGSSMLGESTEYTQHPAKLTLYTCREAHADSQ